MRRQNSLLRMVAAVLATVAVTGCGAQDEAQEPGVRGPVVFRLWDRQARQQNLPPTVIETATVRQIDADFRDLEMIPVQVRRPLADGELWIHAPIGRFHADGADGRRQSVTLQGPVHVTGVLRGIPLSGSAATADVPPGRAVIVLTDLQIVRGGLLMTTPHAELSDGQLVASGPVSLAPGAPAMAAVLGAVP